MSEFDSSPQVALRHPIKRARGLGTAKDGTHHFMLQRITAIALIPLTLYLVWLVISLIGQHYAEVRAIVGRPWNATLLAAFLIAGFWHSKLGLQVVIEDYVHAPLLAGISHLANMFFNALAAIASVLAVIRIALGA